MFAMLMKACFRVCCTVIHLLIFWYFLLLCCLAFFLQDRSENVLYRLKVSFIEIYKEEARDLLEFESKELHIREDDKGNTSKSDHSMTNYDL